MNVTAPWEGGTKEYSLRRIPAPSARVRKHHLHYPGSRTLPATATHAHPAQPKHIAITRSATAQRLCTGAVPRPLKQHSSQPNKQTKQRKEQSIFHIKKISLYVPNLFPKCSHFVPKTIHSCLPLIYLGYKPIWLKESALFPCSQEKSTPSAM